MSAIAIAVFGTGGDIFPCISVAGALREQGHDVTFVTPRWLGLYSRLAGFTTVSVGDGSEKGALTDLPMYTTRFKGMDSWRRSMVDYVFPLLSQNYETFLEQIRKAAPDRIIATAQGYWGSLAAIELGIPWSSFHLYPQLFELSKNSQARSRVSQFARPLAEWLVAQEDRLGLPRSRIPVLDWTVNTENTVSGHDPAVVKFSGRDVATLGFPYWDEAFANNAAVNQACEFLDESGSPRIVVSLGSFIGLIDSDFWRSMATTASEDRCRYLFVGVGERDRLELHGENVCAVSHVPLSKILSQAEMMIHHGGIGSMYAAFNAGIPAIVFPHAFDQSHNSRLVSQLGVGTALGAKPRDWGEDVKRTLNNGSIIDKAKGLRSRLIRPDDAAVAISRRLLDNS